MKPSIQETFDRLGSLRCVRFASGQVGVVDAAGETVLRLGKFKRVEFAGDGFVKVTTSRVSALSDRGLRALRRDECFDEDENKHIFFVDLKSKQMYGKMPELLRYDDFEIAHIGGFLCTRTERFYEVPGFSTSVWKGKDGLYLSLPFRGEPDEAVVRGMVEVPELLQVCLIKGDERKVYWLLGKFKDGSVLVMDERGGHFHVWLNKLTGKAVWRALGTVNNEAERAKMLLVTNEIEAEVACRLTEEAERRKREADCVRKREMKKSLTAVVPFCIGNKWGLKQEGRIIAPPIYRAIKKPVGRYCVFEQYPTQWGVMAIDGKVEVQPRYQEVVLHRNGRVDLTVTRGKVVTRKLP